MVSIDYSIYLSYSCKKSLNETAISLGNISSNSSKGASFIFDIVLYFFNNLFFLTSPIPSILSNTEDSAPLLRIFL